jgi:hypothetical protein
LETVTTICKRAYTGIFQSQGIKEGEAAGGCAGKCQFTQFLETAFFSENNLLSYSTDKAELYNEFKIFIA